METKPTDLLMWVGQEHYATPEAFSNEVFWRGASKRIALTNPPQGLEKGVSRIFFIHPLAGLEVAEPHTLEDLRERLATIESERLAALLQDFDRNPSWVVRRIKALWAEPDPMPSDLHQAVSILDGLGALCVPAIFGHVYYTGMQYVCKADEDDVPERLTGLDVEPIRVVPVEDKEEADAQGN